MYPTLSIDHCPLVEKNPGYRCTRCLVPYAEKPPSCNFWLITEHPEVRGPGTRLANFFARFRKVNCMECRIMQNQMDYYGSRWCLRNLGQLSDDLRLRSGLSRWIAKLLIVTVALGRSDGVLHTTIEQEVRPAG